jgi:hypothetical protein
VKLSCSGVSCQHLLFGQINISLLSVDTNNHHGLLFAHFHVLIDKLNSFLGDFS